jgi:hypothetical protein
LWVIILMAQRRRVSMDFCQAPGLRSWRDKGNLQKLTFCQWYCNKSTLSDLMFVSRCVTASRITSSVAAEGSNTQYFVAHIIALAPE